MASTTFYTQSIFGVNACIIITIRTSLIMIAFCIDLETMEVKDAYKEFNPNLVRSLPLKDAHFIAELTKQGLFYGNLKETVAAESTQSDAAAWFLYEAVERSLDIGNRILLINY